MSRLNWYLSFRRTSFVGGIVCLLVLGCSPSDPPNLLLYVVDTLRVDAVGSYGGEGVSTPNVDTFAAAGILFENAFSSSSWTRPSMASILTGLHPPRHRAQNLFSAVSPNVPTLAERLQGKLAKIPPRNVMLARGGTDYPLSDEELEWQLDFIKDLA